jgi:hypothetical protein
MSRYSQGRNCSVHDEVWYIVSASLFSDKPNGKVIVAMLYTYKYSLPEM